VLLLNLLIEDQNILRCRCDNKPLGEDNVRVVLLLEFLQLRVVASEDRLGLGLDVTI
jgi:hypothetical protein